jgi:hypothetical protein
MRKLFLAGAALFIVSATPGFANDYSGCSRTLANGGSQCDHPSPRNCRAALSGQRGDCFRHPDSAYGPMGNRWPTGANWGGWETGW